MFPYFSIFCSMHHWPADKKMEETQHGHFNYVNDLEHLLFKTQIITGLKKSKTKEMLTLYTHSSGNNIKIQPAQVNTWMSVKYKT